MTIDGVATAATAGTYQMSQGKDAVMIRRAPEALVWCAGCSVSQFSRMTSLEPFRERGNDQFTPVETDF